jgi:hypothetical protein
VRPNYGRRAACQRLTRAIDELDATNQARATTLCMAQLTTLHLDAGELDHAVTRGRQLLEAGAGIRSHRLTEHLTTVHTAAEPHTNEPAVKDLIADLDNLRPGVADR